MNTRISKVLLIVFLSVILGVSAGAAVGTFTFRTSGASDTVEAVDLVYPQRVPESDSVTTESIADDSITNDKLAEPVSVANGGTGKTTAAEGLAALGGASLNGSSTVDFAAGVFQGSVSGLFPFIRVSNTVRLGLNGAESGRITNDDDTTKSITIAADVDNEGVGSYMRFLVDGAESLRLKAGGTKNLSGIQVFADNAAAITGGLIAGDLYRTSSGQLMIVYNP